MEDEGEDVFGEFLVVLFSLFLVLLLLWMLGLMCGQTYLVTCKPVDGMETKVVIKGQ